MKVSYVCVTNRPRFSAAVRAQYDAQEWPDRELVVVDGSEGGVDIDADTTISARGVNVGAMRNVGIEAATGDAVFWLDDDDWRHPRIVSVLAGEMEKTGAPMVGMVSTFWIDLSGGMNRRGRRPWPIFAASLYRNSPPMPKFRTEPPYKTDSFWLLQAFKHYGGRERVSLVDWSRLYVIVTHGENVHNPSLRDEPGPWTERDPAFLPGDPRGLAAHMDRLRGVA